MRIIAIDDNELALEELVISIKEARPSDEVFGFEKQTELLSFAKENICNIAFLDIEMWGMSGLELAKALKDINPAINIIFVTAYSKYMGDAFSLYVSGFVLKPVTKEAVEREIENLRHPVDKKMNTRFYVQTFGNFEVFIYGKPLEFSLKKTKELLAYLVVRRGAWCDVKEIAAVLWEDKAGTAGTQSHLRTLSADLATVLKSAKANEILLKRRGMMAIDPEKFDCDLYRVIKGDLSAVNGYKGEFMAQYSWAEFMNAYFEK